MCVCLLAFPAVESVSVKLALMLSSRLLVGAGPSSGRSRKAAAEHSLPYLLSADY